MKLSYKFLPTPRGLTGLNGWDDNFLIRTTLPDSKTAITRDEDSISFKTDNVNNFKPSRILKSRSPSNGESLSLGITSKKTHDPNEDDDEENEEIQWKYLTIMDFSLLLICLYHIFFLNFKDSSWGFEWNTSKGSSFYF